MTTTAEPIRFSSVRSSMKIPKRLERLNMAEPSRSRRFGRNHASAWVSQPGKAERDPFCLRLTTRHRKRIGRFPGESGRMIRKSQNFQRDGVRRFSLFGGIYAVRKKWHLRNGTIRKCLRFAVRFQRPKRLARWNRDRS